MGAVAAPAQALDLDGLLRQIFNGPGPSAVVYWPTAKHRTHRPPIRPTLTIDYPIPGRPGFPNQVHPGYIECEFSWYTDSEHDHGGYGSPVCHEVDG